MSVRQVVPPSTLPVTMEQARASCRVDHADDDALIGLYIRAALATAERRCNVAFEPQTLELVQNGFPWPRVRLPIGPVVSLASVSYTDATGSLQTISDAVLNEDWLSPAVSWPAAGLTRIRYVAGTGTPDDVKVAILLMVGLYYDNRAEASATAMNSIPFGAEMILRQHHRMFPECEAAGDFDG